MCLVLFSYATTPGYRLILAANRDEFYARRTAPLQRWGGAGKIFSGRDLEAGGTWLGATVEGRFGVITNFREKVESQAGRRSRGEILVSYLETDVSAAVFVERLRNRCDRYRGFNLVVGDQSSLYYCSNRTGAWRWLDSGIYALSNHLLDTPWPKVERGKYLFEKQLREGAVATADFLAMLTDRQQPCESDLPETGIGAEWEKILAPIFIRSEGYGTRSSAVLSIDDNGLCRFFERSYGAGVDGDHSDVEYIFATGSGKRRSQGVEDTNNSEDPRRRSSARE